jgi:methylmalonyl-CoA mutase C-terminal domain/subunit
MTQKPPENPNAGPAQKPDQASVAGDAIIRVLVAKPGLDGHDRGAKVVARGLRDAGFEVIYTGLHQTPEMVVSAAMQEDVDIVGLSILSGAHIPLVTAIQNLMKKQNLNKPIFVGGIIPGDDAKQLLSGGVAAVFGPGSSIQEIVDRIRQIVAMDVSAQ